MIQLSLHKKLHSSTGKMKLDIELEIPPGTFLTLYGKSGAGKTSILRMLAGLLRPDQGHIIVNKTTWVDTQNKTYLPPQKRKAGLVFQDYALFPNMTVRENLEFALLKGQDSKIVSELVELVELGELQSRKTTSLSGGQQQRVALARSLVQRPELLMLDEPLSALDREMRFKLQEYILKLHQEFAFTTILVSHDIPEILKMSDSIIHLEEGKIIKEGKPEDFFEIKDLPSNFPDNGKLLAVEKQGAGFVLTILIGEKQIKVNADLSSFDL